MSQQNKNLFSVFSEINQGWCSTTGTMYIGENDKKRFVFCLFVCYSNPRLVHPTKKKYFSFNRRRRKEKKTSRLKLNSLAIKIKYYHVLTRITSYWKRIIYIGKRKNWQKEEKLLLYNFCCIIQYRVGYLA